MLSTSNPKVKVKKAKVKKVRSFAERLGTRHRGTALINWYSHDQLVAFYEELEGKGTVVAPRLYGSTLEELEQFSASKGNKDGAYWAYWVGCLVTHLKAPRSGHPRLQTRVIPNGLSERWIERWKEADHQAKLAVHHISWIIKNEKDLPDLGAESSVVEHLCDVQGCFKDEHMGPISTISTNVQRAYSGCPGTVIVVDDGCVVKEKVFCKHDDTCIKLLVVKL
jgi:hypothetical protein